MNPIIQHMWTPEERARYGIRGIEDFTPEELALLHEKLAGWLRQQAPQTERTRRRPWVMTKPRTADPA
jgi:hypothetical protein